MNPRRFSSVSRALSLILFVLVVLVVLVVIAAPATAEEPSNRSVIGQWRLTAILAFADISALDEKEAHQLTGKVLTIESTRLKLDKRKCGGSTFRVERVGRDRELRDNAHVRGTTLGLPAKVEVVELSCAYLYLKTRDRAVLAWEGAYFDIIRLRR